jgi:hypothetical protein
VAMLPEGPAASGATAVGCHAPSSCGATSGLLGDATVREHGRGNHGQDDGPETDAVSEGRQNKRMHLTVGTQAARTAPPAGDAQRWADSGAVDVV